MTLPLPGIRPMEHDVQAAILASLGRERMVLTKTKSGSRWARTGIYVSADGKSYYWRANSGKRLYSHTDTKGRTSTGLFKAAPKGTADILGCCCGIAVALECKRDAREKQRPEQVEWQRMHEAAGGVYLLCWHPDQARSLDARIRKERSDPLPRDTR